MFSSLLSVGVLKTNVNATTNNTNSITSCVQCTITRLVESSEASVWWNDIKKSTQELYELWKDTVNKTTYAVTTKLG